MLVRLAVLAGLTLLPALAGATPTACPEHFLDSQAPDLLNPKLSAQTQEICYSGFAVLHSGITRTPLFAAEHLSRERVDAARGLERNNAFHAEPSLPPGQRAELSDYARSGFDRGHMAPSGDMPDPQSQNESFSLANMIPQNPENNRTLWQQIEAAVRDLARAEGELYVVTGPIFQGTTLQRLQGHVLVPTAIFKAIYDPKRKQAAAYVVPNDAGDQWSTVPLSQLEKITGIEVFPDLPDTVKNRPMALPPPTAAHGPRKRNAE